MRSGDPSRINGRRKTEEEVKRRAEEVIHAPKRFETGQRLLPRFVERTILDRMKPAKSQAYSRYWRCCLCMSTADACCPRNTTNTSACAKGPPARRLTDAATNYAEPSIIGSPEEAARERTPTWTMAARWVCCARMRRRQCSGARVGDCQERQRRSGACAVRLRFRCSGPANRPRWRRYTLTPLLTGFEKRCRATYRRAMGGCASSFQSVWRRLEKRKRRAGGLADIEGRETRAFVESCQSVLAVSGAINAP